MIRCENSAACGMYNWDEWKCPECDTALCPWCRKEHDCGVIHVNYKSRFFAKPRLSAYERWLGHGASWRTLG